MSKHKVKRIGILTGGGDCPGLNAVIRGVAKTAIRQHGIEVIGIEDGYDGLVNDRFRELTYDNVSGILTEGGTILGTSNKANPFEYAVRRGGHIVFEDRSDQAVAHCRKHRIDALVCIGGDGTLTIADGLRRKGIPVVGVPKTIDNDLMGTDRTFGFDTAVTVATEAIDRLHTTAESHHRVMVIELMGRNAGWLTLTAGVAGGADVILIPEIPYDVECVYETVRRRAEKGRRFSIVAVSEGARPIGGQQVVQRIVPDSHEKARLGGIGQRVMEDIESATGLESRVVVLGHLQRGGSPTAFDRVLATRFGYEAMRLVVEGRFGRMASLRGSRITSVAISTVAGKQRLVPRTSPLIRTARAVGTEFGDK